MADERKYRHRGYMDTGESREPRSRQGGAERERHSELGAPRGRSAGFDKDLVIACKKCGETIPRAEQLAAGESCPKCGNPLHSCLQCKSFDPSLRFECSENMKLKERIADKNAANECRWFGAATSFDMTGRKAADSPATARAAFEALFKK
jgi:predicted RNA-binding Zn-ribbon protein involved in translation (DUF1610 family)